MPSSDEDKQFAEIWKHACMRYVSLTADASGGKAAAINRASSGLGMENVTTADALLLELDKQQSGFQEYRARSEMIRKVMEPVCQTVELFSNIASGTSSNVREPCTSTATLIVLFRASSHGWKLLTLTLFCG